MRTVEDRGFSLISEIQLQQASLTNEGLFNFLKFAKVKDGVDIQIVDLSNNELGTETALFIEPLIESLIQLNLSGTRLGNKGATEFARSLRDTADTKKCNRGKLRYLDISNNNIGAPGLMKVLGRLKKSQTLVNLNVSGNDMSELANFNQLENILVKNKSLQVFNLSNCKLQSESFVSLSRGLALNTSLLKLILSDNSQISQSLAKICDALIDKSESKLIDLELAKCSITSQSASHLIRLLNSKSKLRHLNLKDNSI